MRWKGTPHFEFDWTTTKSKCPGAGKSIIEQIIESEEINKSKIAGLQESQTGIRVRKLTIWVSSFEIEKLWQSSPDLSALPE